MLHIAIRIFVEINALVPAIIALAVPFAVVLTVFFVFLAVIFIVRFPCCLVFISGFAAVWGVSVLTDVAVTAGRLAVPCISCKPSYPIVHMAFCSTLYPHCFLLCGFIRPLCLEIGDDFIISLLREGVKLDALMLLIKTLGFVIFQRPEHPAALDVVSIDNQIIDSVKRKGGNR